MLAYLTLLLAVPAAVLAHSWIACTKYAGDIFQEGSYSPARCQGFPRDWAANGARAPFGQEFNQFNIFDFRAGRNPAQPVCKSRRSAVYTDQFPAAAYRPGERIKVIWPSKNHGGPGNGKCTDNHSDRQDLIYAFCGGRDPRIGEVLNRNNGNLVADLKVNGGKGFKNCLNYCSDTDKSPCQGEFTVPMNLSGRCTFVWLWELNQGEFYTSCWEADVSSGTITPAPSTAAPVVTPAPTPSTFIRVSKVPQPIPINGQFDIEVQWRLGTEAQRTLIVDILSLDFNTFFGNGFQHQFAGENLNGLKVQLSRQIGEGQEVYIKLYLVERAVYERDPSNAWRSALIDSLTRVRASASGLRTV